MAAKNVLGAMHCGGVVIPKFLARFILALAEVKIDILMEGDPHLWRFPEIVVPQNHQF